MCPDEGKSYICTSVAAHLFLFLSRPHFQALREKGIILVLDVTFVLVLLYHFNTSLLFFPFSFLSFQFYGKNHQINSLVF